MSTSESTEPTTEQQDLAQRVYSAMRGTGANVSAAKTEAAYKLMELCRANTAQANTAARRAALAYEQQQEQAATASQLSTAIEQLADHDRQSAPPITGAAWRLMEAPTARLVELPIPHGSATHNARVALILSQLLDRDDAAPRTIRYTTADQEADNLIQRMSMIDAPSWRGLLVDALARAEASGIAQGLTEQ